MDYIREFDIKLDKEYYYAGEQISGTVILDTIENFKLKSKCLLYFFYYTKEERPYFDVGCNNYIKLAVPPLRHNLLCY